MKTKEFKSLRAKDSKDLVKMVREKRAEAAKKEVEIRSGKEKNIKLLGNIRHEIAKILTLIKEKEILEKLESQK